MLAGAQTDKQHVGIPGAAVRLRRRVILVSEYCVVMLAGARIDQQRVGIPGAAVGLRGHNRRGPESGRDVQQESCAGGDQSGQSEQRSARHLYQ